MQRINFVILKIDDMIFKANRLFCSNQIHLISLPFLIFTGFSSEWINNFSIFIAVIDLNPIKAVEILEG